MQLIKRSAFGWGATGASHAKPRQGLVIHYDGSNQQLQNKPHGACVVYWKRTRSFHVGPSRQWVDIGYSFGCCPHGMIFEGRGEDRAQAAQPGGNTTWYSVTLMSGPDESPTEAQIEAVRELRAYLMGKGLGAAVKGHRDFYATSCPGDRLYRLVKDGTFAKPPKGSKTASKTSQEDDVDVNDVWHKARIKMNKGEKTESERSPAAFLQELETEQDRIKARLDGIAATQQEILAKLNGLTK